MKKNLWKKRLLSILTVIALIFVIITYTKVTIKAEINETEVVVTKVDIPPRTEITDEMLETIVVPAKGVPTNAFKNKEDIIGKWTVAGYGISKHSFIYKDKIVDKSELPDAGLLELKENEVAVPLLVDLETSLGNSIIPNTHVDLYFRTVLHDNNQTKALYGKVASQVRVVAVKDAEASNVFDVEGYQQGKPQEAANNEKKSLAKIYIFAVPKEIGELINKAKLLGEVVPIATGKTYEENAKTTADKNEVVAYIKQASFVPTDKTKDTAQNNDQNNEEGEM
jgi:pilus assembly protein CpaB